MEKKSYIDDDDDLSSGAGATLNKLAKLRPTHPEPSGYYSYFIFVTGTTVPVEKNSAMWRNFRLNAEIVPFKCGENLSHGEISPHEKCGDKSVNIMCTIFDVLSHFMLFCCKIFLLCDLRCFVAKSVLS